MKGVAREHVEEGTNKQERVRLTRQECGQVAGQASVQEEVGQLRVWAPG